MDMANEMANGFREYKIDDRIVTREEFIAAGGSETPTIIEPPAREHPAVDAEYLLRKAVQDFFAELAVSATPPHASNEFKSFVREMLNQAQTRGLYTPEPS